MFVRFFIPGKVSWLSHIQNTGRWNYSALASRWDSIYLFGFYVLISFTSLSLLSDYLQFPLIVYYKSSNWRENDYNWACFYSNKILCVGWEQNFVFNNKCDQLLSFLLYNCYLRVNCIVLFKLFTSW